MIYICHTTYHLLMTLVTAYARREKVSILLGVEFPNSAFYCSKLISLDIIESCYDISPLINMEKFFISDIKCRNYLDSILNKERDIYIFNDSRLEGRYLRSHKREYTLVEDGLNSFKMDYFGRVCEKSKKRLLIGKIFGLNVGKDEKNSLIKCLIVNDQEILNKHNYKVVEVSRRELFCTLSELEKEKIWGVFSDEEIEQSIVAIKRKANKIGLLLTQPLFKDNLVKSEVNQINIYKQLIVSNKCDGVIIKPHPRDEVDYSKYFNNCIIINRRDFPIELFNFISEIQFELALTISSTSIDGLININNRIKVGEDILRSIPVT